MDDLTPLEKRIRKTLVSVAAGREKKTAFKGLITYKELWEKTYRGTWTRGGLQESIIDRIVNISRFEVLAGRPPLNEIVVNRKTRLPGEEWENLKEYILRGGGPRYRSHHEAQAACWAGWSRPGATAGKAIDPVTLVYEGELQEIVARTRKRRRDLALKCKVRDNFACRACERRICVEGRFAAEAHHKRPLASYKGGEETRLEDLVTLCPTCHRIAHFRSKKPYSIVELRKLAK